MIFDGRKTRDDILADLSKKVAKMKRKPTLAVFLIGSDPISAKYDDIKKKFAEKIGANFCLYKFDEKDSEAEIVEAIEYLNSDPETDGIMVQIPVPKKFDRTKLIEAISPEKDVDGLRYCLGLDSKFQPPVVLSVMEAIRQAELRIKNTELSNLKIILIGHGFLVGAPLCRALNEQGINPLVILNEVKNPETQRSLADAQDDIKKADVIISATGCISLIRSEMVKDGVVLIDAGTSEENGQICGDIDEEVYKKASFYTPVPGGIGPVTVAMLYQNLIDKF